MKPFFQPFFPFLKLPLINTDVSSYFARDYPAFILSHVFCLSSIPYLLLQVRHRWDCENLFLLEMEQKDVIMIIGTSGKVARRLDDKVQSY